MQPFKIWENRILRDCYELDQIIQSYSLFFIYRKRHGRFRTTSQCVIGSSYRFRSPSYSRTALLGSEQWTLAHTCALLLSQMCSRSHPHWHSLPVPGVDARVLRPRAPPFPQLRFVFYKPPSAPMRLSPTRVAITGGTLLSLSVRDLPPHAAQYTYHGYGVHGQQQSPTSGYPGAGAPMSYSYQQQGTSYAAPVSVQPRTQY